MRANSTFRFSVLALYIIVHHPTSALFLPVFWVEYDWLAGEQVTELPRGGSPFFLRSSNATENVTGSIFRRVYFGFLRGENDLNRRSIQGWCHAGRREAAAVCVWQTWWSALNAARFAWASMSRWCFVCWCKRVCLRFTFRRSFGRATAPFLMTSWTLSTERSVPACSSRWLKKPITCRKHKYDTQSQLQVPRSPARLIFRRLRSQNINNRRAHVSTRLPWSKLAATLWSALPPQTRLDPTAGLQCNKWHKCSKKLRKNNAH